MIVVGVDAHMETHTAAAIDAQTARRLAELTVPAREPGFAQLLDWARGLDLERVWAIEDVRNLSGSLAALQPPAAVLPRPPPRRHLGRRGRSLPRIQGP